MSIEEKTGESERKELKEYLKSEHGIELTPLAKRVYFADQTGKRYCLLVAREESGKHTYWHGLDKEVVTNGSWEEGSLIIAICDTEKMEIYQGPIKLLIQKRVYNNFNTERNWDCLTIKEIPELQLKKIGEKRINSIGSKSVYKKMITAGIDVKTATEISGYTPKNIT